jgi:hypothetical protein
VTNAPALTSPSDGAIVEIPFSQSNGQISLRWESVPNAATYEYIIRYGATGESGELLEQGQTAATLHLFTREPSSYGIAIKWKVRGLNAAGVAGPWSVTRIFFFSYPIGAVMHCSSSSCPAPNAWYQISRDREDTGMIGVPVLLIADWVSADCTRGRTATAVSFGAMSGYHRSARYDGCPP